MRRSEGTTTAAEATTTWWEIIYISFICQAHSPLLSHKIFRSLFFSPRFCCWLSHHPPLFCEMLFFVCVWKRNLCFVSSQELTRGGLSDQLEFHFYCEKFLQFCKFATCFLSIRHIRFEFTLKQQQFLKAIEKSICEIRCAQKGERIKRNLITQKNMNSQIFFKCVYFSTLNNGGVFLGECLLFAVVE